jgi:superfamily II DNA or RNA helicase
LPKIIVANKFSKIEDENDIDFLSRLNTHLSFKYAGSEFSPAFKNHFWDGKEYLLSKKLVFTTGLLDRVKTFYRDSCKEVEIVDTRDQFIFGKEIDISKNIEKLGITPYDYQLAAVEKAIENERIIFKHATSSGKSLTTAMITAKLGLPTTVWVIGKDLLVQFHKLFSDLFDEPIGFIGDGVCNVERINIASIWSAGRALGLKGKEIFLDDDVGDEKYEPTDQEKIIKLVKETKIHHFDEAHISASKTIRTIYKNSNPSKLYAWSGTPWRNDGADLLIEGIFGQTLHEVKASDLIRRGIVSKPFIKFVYVKGNAHFTDTYTKVYSENVVNNDYRNNIIVEETKKLVDKGYQTLVLFKQIKHGKILRDLFEGKGIEVEFLTGKDSAEKREEVKNNLLNKKANICLASQIYDIGISIETLSGLVLASGGSSSSRCLQRVGRIIRGGEIKGKPYAAVIDILDSVKYLKKHSLIRKSVYEYEEEFVIKMPKEYKEKQ